MFVDLCHRCVAEVSAENLRTCFQIVNAYLYLSATEFLQVSDLHLLKCPYQSLNIGVSLSDFSHLLPELCRVVVQVLLRPAKWHYKRGTSSSSKGTIARHFSLKLLSVKTCTFTSLEFKCTVDKRSPCVHLEMPISEWTNCTIILMSGVN